MGWVRQRNGGHATSARVRVPLARSEELVVEDFEHELLIYDRKNKRAHCLGATAARVWQACDGSASVDEVAGRLELSRDAVLQAIADLETSELLDIPELQVVDGNGNGNGNGNGLTRREFSWRSAKVSAAAAAVPLVYSIAVPSAMAAASPTNFVCALFSVKDCGTNVGAGAVTGCCCCCQGCGSCKVGGSIAMCTSVNCAQAGCNSGAHCSNSCFPSDTNCAHIAPNSTGCCGVSGSVNCGCAFAHGGSVTTTCDPSTPGCTNPCTPGAKGCGAGCCSSVTGAGCTPGDPNCVPCCNGTPITSSAQFDCCTPGPTSTC